MSLPLSASQILAVWSKPADKIFVPCGLKTAFETSPSWPYKMLTQSKVETE